MTMSCADTDTQCPEIRPARQADLLALSLQDNAIADEHRPSLSGDQTTSTLTLLAEADDRVVAVVHLDLQTDQVGYIHGLWIADEYHASTLSMRMMRTVLRESKKLGCQKVDMDAATKAYAVIAMLVESDRRYKESITNKTMSTPRTIELV